MVFGVLEQAEDRLGMARALRVAFWGYIGYTNSMAFDLKETVAARLGENYQLHERHLNRTLVAAQRVIGFYIFYLLVYL